MTRKSRSPSSGVTRCACIPCHRGKTKCDRDALAAKLNDGTRPPCSRCIRLGRPELCIDRPPRTNVKVACVACVKAKRGCGHERPCLRCKSRGIPCVDRTDDHEHVHEHEHEHEHSQVASAAAAAASSSRSQARSRRRRNAQSKRKSMSEDDMHDWQGVNKKRRTHARPSSDSDSSQTESSLPSSPQQPVPLLVPPPSQPSAPSRAHQAAAAAASVMPSIPIHADPTLLGYTAQPAVVDFYPMLEDPLSPAASHGSSEDDDAMSVNSMVSLSTCLSAESPESMMFIGSDAGMLQPLPQAAFAGEPSASAKSAGAFVHDSDLLLAYGDATPESTSFSSLSSPMSLADLGDVTHAQLVEGTPVLSHPSLVPSSSLLPAASTMEWDSTLLHEPSMSISSFFQ